MLSYLHFDGKLSVAQLKAVSPQYFTAQWPLFMLLPALGSLLYLIPFLCIRYSKRQKEQVERELIERHEREAAMAQPTHFIHKCLNNDMELFRCCAHP